MIKLSVVLGCAIFSAAILAAYARVPVSQQNAAPQYVSQDDTCAADPVDDADADENDLFSTTLELVCA